MDRSTFLYDLLVTGINLFWAARFDKNINMVLSAYILQNFVIYNLFLEAICVVLKEMLREEYTQNSNNQKLNGLDFFFLCRYLLSFL